MTESIALIFIAGMSLGYISKKIHLPSLVGMILTGIILSPYMFNLIDSSILNISSELRQIALVIILTRSGLSLNISDLKKSGKSAVLMCFVPATFEIVGTLLVAPSLFGINYKEALLLGSVISAVSPAVIVPRMINLIENGYGKKHCVPQTILAGASADDVYVIVLFTSFTALVSGNSDISPFTFIQIPVSVILGILMGITAGFLFSKYFKKVHIRDTAKVIIMLSISFLMIALQDMLENKIRISALIAIMTIGISLNKFYPDITPRLSSKYNKLWTGAEILLFVLVGAEVNLDNAMNYGFTAVIYIFTALLFRMAGVFVSLIKSPFTLKERFFCMISYTPKATVQAAIGAVPLAMGLPCGQIILTSAVLSILITAPLGAFAVDLSYKKLLSE